MRSPVRWRIVCLGGILILSLASLGFACTSLLVSPGATEDGSSFVTYSCDGGIFAAVTIIPGATHPEGAEVTIYDETTFLSGSALEAPALGTLPQANETFRYLDAMAGPTYSHIGGMNEHGVSVAETTLVDVRPELANPYGLLAPFSTCAGRSLMTLALQRARTARDAVLLIGDLAETYGYSSPYPVDGEQISIADGREAWSMEIFGPGGKWRPESGEPGAIWCAQRIPDGHVGISANRSRIGVINLDDPDTFLASPNVTSLAQRNGWWDPASDGPFDWSEAYAPGVPPGTLIREWRAFDLVAPSLELSPEGPIPFSVAPDHPLTTQDVMAIQRDLLEGTPFDVTADDTFSTASETSPLACPMCSWDFYDLLDLVPERTISNRRASFTALYQSRADVPDELAGCTWYAFGPAATSCYVPIYSGATTLPDAWGSTALASGDLELAFWTMILPGFLATTQWQDAYEDIVQVRARAEARFAIEQSVLTQRIAEWLDAGEDSAEKLNEYTAARLNAVLIGYEDLATHLIAEYVIGIGRYLTSSAPVIPLPPLR